jgi:retron-type reverse transcriptase
LIVALRICTLGSIEEPIGHCHHADGYIPKADGQQRPLAVAALEDKIVQGAACAVLNAIYEEDFLGFSYGFRPKRNPHDALDALTFGIYSTKVNYIFDADLRRFLDRDSYYTPACAV